MIIPSSKYPAQTAVDLTNYPQGKARNVTVANDGSGTPLEQSWLNDWFGFQQAAALAAGITPSGTPDTALTSQLLAAISAVTRPQNAFYHIAATSPATSGTNYVISLAQQSGGYSLVSNAVVVPAAGSYLVTFSGELDSSNVGNPVEIAVSIAVNGAALSGSTGHVHRYSGTIAEVTTITKSFLVSIATPSSQAISLISTSAAHEFSFPGLLTIERQS